MFFSDNEKKTRMIKRRPSLNLNHQLRMKILIYRRLSSNL